MRAMIVTAVVLAWTVAVTLCTAPSARAGEVGTRCAGTSTVTYTPGLTATARPTTIVTDATLSCASSDPSITGGTTHAGGRAEIGCGPAAGVGTSRIDWNNGRHSTFRFRTVFADRPAGQTVIVVSGTVVDGEFLGDQVDGAGIYLTPDLAGCATATGVTSTTGPLVRTFRKP
ncbi:hypothetical protein [Nocardia mikamii]|uniref:hypothetical protein n=1 Tax=Nocardia mikamii TaxID=508464 RepID=UPI000A935711|nr:hypothetical protein [Nocardia mikamii]